MRVIEDAVFTLLIIHIIGIPWAVIAADTIEPDGTSAERQWGRSIEGQSISVDIAKNRIAPGEAIVLTVAMKNVGKEEIKLVRQYRIFETYQLTVLQPGGNEAPLTLFGQLNADETHPQTGSFAIEALKPGEEEATTIVLSRLFDMSLAGKYVVVARRKVWKSGRVDPNLKATSNKLEITVDERLEAKLRSE